MTEPTIVAKIADRFSLGLNLRLCLLILAINMFESGFSQDIIVRKSGDTIVCKITKVDSLNIAFRIQAHGGTRINTILTKDSVSDYKYGVKIDKAIYSWVSFGAGLSNFSSGSGDIAATSVGINYYLLYNRNLFSLSYIKNTENGWFKPAPRESVWNIGVLYGRILKAPHFLCSLSSGISYVSGTERGDFVSSYMFFSKYEVVSIKTFGIPIESQLLWAPFPFVGVGVNGFANINSQKSFLGALLFIQFGKLY